jgi:sugar/nucleoside kinase (ribokinase family)
MKHVDVIVVGEVFADHVFSGFRSWPAPGEEVHTDHYLRELGGGTVNTACALARLQRRVRIVGLIGEADRPWFASRLGGFGLSADGLRSDALGTGTTVSISTADDRCFYTYPGANRHLPDLLREPAVLDELASARHVHFAMPLAASQARQLLPALREAGCTTSLDVGFSSDWLRDADNRWTCRTVDHFLPNQKEAEILCGRGDLDAFRDWIAAMEMPCGVIKLGADGAAAFVRDHWQIVQPPRVDALDTTGAGDAFNAGFITGLLAGESMQTCLRRACICGALCTTQPGALAGLPDSSSLQKTYEQTYGS